MALLGPPLNGERSPRKHACEWRASSILYNSNFNRSNLRMLIFRRYNLLYTNHKWVTCVLLFLLPTDFNARHQLVQWTPLHVHSGGTDFQTSHKTDSLKKTFSYSKRKKRRPHHSWSLLCPVHEDLIERHTFTVLLLYGRIRFSLSMYLIF